tara:strand:- start:149 stop:523 length:375 start_codon:yes stop_codon:yes gene_type:complete
MLRRKYLNSKARNKITNKAAAAPSSSARLNRLKKSVNCVSCAPDMKLVPDTTQSEYISEKRVKQHVCNGDTRVTPKTRTCHNNGDCDVTKDLSILSQGSYVETALPAKCVINQPKKPMAHNIKC